MLDTLIVTLITIAIAVIGNGFIMKYMISELKRQMETFFRRLDEHGDEIIKLKTKSELAMTSKDVDEKYVSKELFRQFEKHIDKRFDSLETGQSEILTYVRKTDIKG